MAAREALLAQTFVDISDTLVADFDVVEFLAVLADRCVELLGTTEAGIMLTDAGGVLRIAASSSEQMNLLSLLELQHDDGPCVECFRTRATVRGDNLAEALERWPRFAPEAITAGFLSAYALPMRLRDQVIGSLNLLRAEPGVLDDQDLVVAQALADVATIGILQHRATDEHRLIAEQLQYALDSRIVIEQAKGVLGAQANLPMDEAFRVMREYTRSRRERLADVAHAVANRTLSADDLLGRTAGGGGG